MRYSHLALGFTIAAFILALSVVLLIPNSIAQVMDSKNASHKYYFDAEKGVYMVKAGGGGARIMVSKYFPTELEIKVGDTVTWYNPTKVPEPHTVTFIKNPNNYPELIAPYAISDSSQLTPLPPGSNSEPLVVPSENGGGKVVLAANARVFYPAVIDSSGKETTLTPNANYTMDGTEQYVNSGWLLPQGQSKLFPGTSETFTVKFEKSGTYPYTCIFHPWMTGNVIVK